MQQVQERVEELCGFVIDFTWYRLSVCRLHQLEIPCRELVPEQLVDRHQCLAEPVFAEQVYHLGSSLAALGLKPAHGDARCLGHLGCVGHLPALRQAESVPYLVVEVASLLAQCLVEEDVVASRSGQHQTHAHAVGTILVYQLQRVGRVAERLGHLASQLVAHDAREVDVAERHLPLIFVARHNHACHPEEDDVGTCHEVVRRVVVLYLGIARVQNAVEQRYRPKPRREPRVQAVGVLPQVFGLQTLVAGLLPCQLQGFLRRLRHDIAALGHEVCRNAVSPPQLAADAPVLDVLQPVAVGVLVFRRIELQLVVHHRRQGHVGKMPHLQEPLHRQLRLDGHIRALAEAHLVDIRLDLLHQSAALEVGLDLTAHVEAVHADIQSGSLADGAVVVEDVYRRQVVLLAQHVVVHVVCRCHLQAARSELNVHVVVFDDGNDAVHQRHDDLLAAQPVVLRVLGVDAHCRVAHYRLGARRGNDGIAAALAVAVHHLALFACLARQVVVGDVVSQVVQLAVLLLIYYYLLVAQSRQCLRVPVHHAHAAINQSFII